MTALIPELAARVQALEAERLRPEIKPDGWSLTDHLTDLVAALSRLFTTTPDA